MQKRWLVLIVVLGVGVAHAQPAPDPAAAAYQEGRRLYDIREWDQAIVKFKEAYRLQPEARSLFNIAQSYRLKGDCVEALGFYKTFKRNYPTEQTDKVDKFIIEMDACAKAVRPADPIKPVVTPDAVKPDPVKPADTVKPDPIPPVVTPKPDPIKPELVSVSPPPAAGPLDGRPPTRPAARSWMKWTGIATMGVGVIAMGLGAKFALDGRKLGDDLREACAISCTSAQALAIEDNGQAANSRAVIGVAVGGVAIAGGIVLFVLSRSAGETPPSVSITPTRGGASASYSLTF